LLELLVEIIGVEVVSDAVFDCVIVVVVVIVVMVVDGVGAGARFFFEPAFRDTRRVAQASNDTILNTTTTLDNCITNHLYHLKMSRILNCLPWWD